MHAYAPSVPQLWWIQQGEKAMNCGLKVDKEFVSSKRLEAEKPLKCINWGGLFRIRMNSKAIPLFW